MKKYISLTLALCLLLTLLTGCGGASSGAPMADYAMKQEAAIEMEEAPMAMDFEGVHREEMTELAAANMGGFFDVVGPYLEAGTMAPQVLYGAPVVLVLTVPKGASQYAMYDLGAFAEQLMLAAADRGISSLVAAMFVAYPDVLRAELPIPEDEAIAIGIGLGYASEAETNGIVAPRMAVDDFLTVCE